MQNMLHSLQTTLRVSGRKGTSVAMLGFCGFKWVGVCKLRGHVASAMMRGGPILINTSIDNRFIIGNVNNFATAVTLQLDWTDLQYKSTKNKFADEPEGLRQFRYHRWKALGEENSDLPGIFLCNLFSPLFSK